eukprot:XP_011671312.1 PREDICTED: protein sidekick-2-like [Strongylocentrotus purpuratus]
MTSHSITIRWTPWNETYDRGDGPVIGYRVYYNTHGQDDTARASRDLIRDTTFTITNLTRDTEYDFRVTASREGPAGEGMYSSAERAWTKCTAPSEAPVLSVRNKGQTTITLDWEVITEESWGCSALSGLKINVSTYGQNGFPRTLSFNTTAGTANIGELEDCSTYNINAAFRNKDELGISSEIFSVSTSLTRPAGVEALLMLPSTTQIKVSWTLSSSLCSADYYIVRYSLYQKLVCSSPESTQKEFEVNTNVTQYNNLVGLEPYSRYKISVTAVNGAGQSVPTISYSNTRPGAPSNITNVRVNPERTSPTRLGFTWQPLNCSNVNGDFWYYYPRIYKDGDRSRTPAGREYLDDDFSYSSVEFNGLETCTMYELYLYACNHHDVSYPCGKLSHAIGVTGVTSPGMPVITELTPHQEDSGTTGLTVSWQPPSSPPCQPTYYEIKYYILQGDMCEDNSRDRIMTSAGTVNGSTFTFNVLELRPNSEYMVFVRGRTSSGYGDSDSQSAITGYSYPAGPPTNIQPTITRMRNIIFTWEKPECGYRNGPISSYEVMFFNSAGDVVYHGNVSGPPHEISDLISYSNYSISIRAWNYELAGVYSLPIWAQTNEARPASVEALQMSPSTTQIEVSWEPSSSPSSADYYIIRYSLYQKLACQSPETTPTEFEVNTNVTQYNNLVGLEPYSRYKITVTAVHGAGQSEPTIDYSDTRPGAPSNITNVRVNPERTSPTRIGFTWQPLNCRNVNGVFWYYHARIYKDGYRSYGMAGRAYLDDDFSHSSVEFNGLVACTMYELNIYACNHDDVSNTCGNLSHAIGVTGVTSNLHVQ